jgi:hypothetical protein
MKRNIVVIRFGAPTPFPKEIKFMCDELVAEEDREKAVGLPFHDMGIASIICTEMDPVTIARKFKELADLHEDVLPVIVFELGDPRVGINLVDVPGWNETVDAYRNRAGVEQVAPAVIAATLSLDELLDLVNRKGGVAKLSPDELARLKELSQE